MKTQPLVAWRVWQMRGNELCAQSSRFEWLPGVNRADCHARPRHSAPQADCACGLYGVDFEYFRDQRGWLTEACHRLALGAALFWGHVVRHKLGVRSEYAAVGCLVGRGDLERRIAARYGVPLVRTLEESLAWARQQDAVVLEGAYPFQRPLVGFVPACYWPRRRHAQKAPTSSAPHIVVSVVPPVRIWWDYDREMLGGAGLEPLAVLVARGWESEALRLPLDLPVVHTPDEARELAASHGAEAAP